jgi:hypothetical protein
MDQITAVKALNQVEKGAILKKHKVFPFSPPLKKLKKEYGESKCPSCDEKMPRGFYFFTPDFNEFYV